MRVVALISVIVVVFACFVNGDGVKTSEPVKNNNSNFMVDLTLVVDLIVRYGPSEGRTDQMDTSHLVNWIGGLFSNWNEAEFQELHLAIAVATETHSDVLKMNDLDLDLITRVREQRQKDKTYKFEEFVKRAIVGNFTFSDPPVNVKKMVEYVNKMVYNSTQGDRPHVPNIIAYIGTTQWRDRDAFPVTVDKAINLFNDADIVVLSDGWADKKRTAIVHKKSAGQSVLPQFNDADVPESKEAFKTAVQSLLDRCPTYIETNGTTCYYREPGQNSCKRTDVYVGSLANLSDEAGKKYCVNGNNNVNGEVCGGKYDGGECDATCKKFMGWSECSCSNRTKYRNLTSNRLIEHCLGYNLTATACTPVDCQTTTDKEEGYYEIAVPVWAILMFTFLIVVILTVLVTLFIYFTIFPPPYDSEKESARTDRWHHRWHHRVHGGVRSMYRRGGTGATDRSTVRSTVRTDRTDRNTDRFAAKTRNNDRSDYRR